LLPLIVTSDHFVCGFVSLNSWCVDPHLSTLRVGIITSHHFVCGFLLFNSGRRRGRGRRVFREGASWSRCLGRCTRCRSSSCPGSRRKSRGRLDTTTRSGSWERSLRGSAVTTSSYGPTSRPRSLSLSLKTSAFGPTSRPRSCPQFDREGLSLALSFSLSLSLAFSFSLARARSLSLITSSYGPTSRPRSSLGLTYFKVDMLSIWYKFVNFGATPRGSAVTTSSYGPTSQPRSLSLTHTHTRSLSLVISLSHTLVLSLYRSLSVCDHGKLWTDVAAEVLTRVDRLF